MSAAMRGLMSGTRSHGRGTRNRRYQAGAAAVEFALVLIPLLVLAFGVVEYGRAIYHYDAIVKSVRAASRMLAGYDPTDSASFAGAATQARCLAVFGQTNCEGSPQPLAPGLTTSHIKICTRASVVECPDLRTSDVQNVSTGSGTGTVQLLVVRVDGYQFGFLGLPFTGAGTSVQFKPVSSVMRGL
jgi:Flp pilus assembly protein TadG